MPNWSEVLSDIQNRKAEHTKKAQHVVDIVRREYLAKLHKHSKRNIIAYYSGWQSKAGIVGMEINDEDKNGFMMAVHKLNRKLGLDLILHTPGGRVSATESIVDYLHKMFNGDVRAIVPQTAMSAGAMMACSCKTIILGTHSNIGPIDPQLSNVPAHGVVQEFKRAFRECKKDPTKIALWQPIIGKYQPTFLSQCENAIKWSNNFVQAQLENVMFKGDPKAKAKARHIVKKLTDYRGNKAHDRHIHFEECAKIGLNVEKLEADPELQDLVLTVHHCFMHALQNTNSFKMIENHLGVALVKQQVTQQVVLNSG